MTPDEKVKADVEEFGWHVIKAEEDASGPGFAFTIGLTHNFGRPELIVFGLPPDVMHQILNLAGDNIRACTEKFESGMKTTELLEGYAWAFIEFPKSSYHDFLGYAIWFYKGEEFDVLQCVWPDKAGRFPWEAGVLDEFKKNQPVPGMSIH
jgi:hypothetical protein